MNGGHVKMMQKKKVLALQVSELSKENDELRACLNASEKNAEKLGMELETRGAELIDLNSRFADSESSLKKTTAELNACRGELASAKRKLDEYRLRQESIVNALTDARETRERIIAEANEQARAIIDSANSERDVLIEKARAEVEQAHNEALSINRRAEDEARRICDDAVEQAAGLIDSAEKDAQARMDEVDSIIIERRAQIDDLNNELAVRAKAALEQTELYAALLREIAESKANELPANECNFDCENCPDKCDDFVPDSIMPAPDKPESSEPTARRAPKPEPFFGNAPCGKDTPCCAGDHANATADANARDDLTDNVPAAKAEIQGTAIQDEDSDKPVPEKIEKPTEPDYSGVAELMKNIYSIEEREMPDELDDEVLDVGEGTPLMSPSHEEAEPPIPVDDGLADILKSIL